MHRSKLMYETPDARPVLADYRASVATNDHLNGGVIDGQ